MNEIIISIKPKYVEKILCGEKTVELRTKRANLQPGTKMWIYSTLPKGEICAYASVVYVYTDAPESIWARYWDDIAITEDEYWKYVGERQAVSIIKLSEVDAIETGATLKKIKDLLGAFTPPQFFMRLENSSPLHSLLNSAT